MRKANVAIIGCGYWGSKIIKTCSSIESIDLIKLFDHSAQCRSLTQKQYPNLIFYDTLLDVIHDSQIDAVIVATELSTHFDLTKQLLMANKHVLCEKPLAPTVEQCNYLGQIADKHSVLLMVGHTYLFNPTILQIKDLLASHSIGDVKKILFQRCNFGPVRDDADAVYDLATHDISIANFLLDALPVGASANGNNISGGRLIDSCSIHLSYPSDVSVDMYVSWAEPIKTRSIKIVGARGSIYFDDMLTEFNATLYQYEAIVSSDMDNSEKNKNIKSEKLKAGATSPLHNQISHFVECTLNNMTPKSNWTTAVDVVKVIEAIEKSMVSNGQLVKV